MSFVFFAGRMPIRKLLKHSVPLFAVECLAKQFDMFQVIDTSDETVAAGCVILEHLLRPVFMEKEFQFFHKQLTPELHKFLERCDSSSAEARSPFDALAAGAQTSLILPAANLPQVMRVYFVEKGRLAYQQTAGDNTNVIPKSYLLKLDRGYAILYMPTITFIDGFDPSSGEHRPSLLPSLLLKKARSSILSFSQKRDKQALVGESQESREQSIDVNTSQELPRGLGVFSISDFQPLLDESPGLSREIAEVDHTENQLTPEVVPPRRTVSETNQQTCCAYNCQLF